MKKSSRMFFVGLFLPAGCASFNDDLPLTIQVDPFVQPIPTTVAVTKNLPIVIEPIETSTIEVVEQDELPYEFISPLVIQKDQYRIEVVSYSLERIEHRGQYVDLLF